MSKPNASQPGQKQVQIRTLEVPAGCLGNASHRRVVQPRDGALRGRASPSGGFNNLAKALSALDWYW